MKKLFTLILLISVIAASSQSFVRNSYGTLETSVKPILNATINGKVKIKDIYYPDDNFQCLSPLGNVELEERHSVVGDEYEFSFDGLLLSFDNINTESKMTLLYIEIVEGDSFISINNANPLKANSRFIDFLDPSEKGRIDMTGSKEIDVRFPDDEGNHMLFETIDGKICKIRIWL